MVTPLPHMPCSWCEMVMGLTETETSGFTVDQDGIRIYYHNGIIDDYHKKHPPISTSTVYLCYWCRQFESKEDYLEDTHEYFNQLIYQVLIGNVDRSIYTGV